MLSSTVSSSFFPLSWQTPRRQHVRWCCWSFSRASLCTWAENWQWPWTRSIVLCVPRFRFFYRRSHSTSWRSVKGFIWESRLISSFRLRRFFMLLIMKMIYFPILVYQNLLCLYNVFAFEIISSIFSFAYIIWLCAVPLAASVISWFLGIIGSCFTGV